MQETFTSVYEWQVENFPDATLSGIFNHIREEWNEFQDAPTLPDRIEEAIDLIILLSFYINRVPGFDTQSVLNNKMARNRSRKWNIQPDGTGRHSP